jgi:serine/threonine-protein kinase
MAKVPEISKICRLIPKAQRITFINKGAFKYVYKVEFKDGVEALKLVMIPSAEHDENGETIKQENVRRIQREISILGKCRSPFLVKLGGLKPTEVVLGEDCYILYSEEYLNGVTLRERIRKKGGPGIKELSILMRCLLHVIKEMASQGIIHRDIKPENIVVLNNNTARPFVLLDLGIAYVAGGTALTRDPRIIPGTTYYIAPEMLDQDFRRSLDYRADLYTCGLVLYEYATGRNPFARAGEPDFTTLYRIKTQYPPSLISQRQDLPAVFCGIVDGLIRKKPVLRPSNIDKLLKITEAYL